MPDTPEGGAVSSSVPAELRPPQAGTSNGNPPRQRHRAQPTQQQRPRKPAQGNDAAPSSATNADSAAPANGNKDRSGQRRRRNRKPTKKATDSRDGDDKGKSGEPDHDTASTVSTASERDHEQPKSTSSAQRRKQRTFEAKLTSSTTTASTGASGSNAPRRPAVKLPQASSAAVQAAAQQNQTLSERLAHEMSTGKYDCSICFNAISKTAAIHSCTTCHAAFHLACISKWATHSVQETAERAALLATSDPTRTTKVEGTWRCPGCQTTFAAAQVPHEYRCFCRRIRNPQHQPPATPHSCAQQCARPRPGDCKHACSMQCHPGPCPPCVVVRRMPCHCGKQTLQLRCASLQTNDDAVLSCRDTCGKQLECGLHTCDRPCHAGECGPCETVREKTCYCGKSTVEESCGKLRDERKICHAPATSTDAWTGEWTCERLCEAKYDCGKHACESRCHPHTSAEPEHCPYSPDTLTSCPCGQTRLSTLVDAPRTSCESPVPTCNKTCSKSLGCGHSCMLPCHTGPCGPCNAEIKVVCRCGSMTQSRRCGDPDSHEELLCERVCKAMRACGRHECNRKCCPLAYQEASRASGKKGRRKLEDALSDEANDPTGLHVCDRVCGRKLSCGMHTCEERDHRGPCPPCLRAGFDELVCNCGSTVMLPPIPCGAAIDCRHPCIREPPCGHPQMPHACHENPECPPCPFLMRKRCACGKKEVANVRCSQERISCGQTCGKLLQCGYHRCRKPCHPTGECEQTCDQICLKPRRICGHPCPEPCHAPSTCPITTPCPKLIDVTCECGHLKQQTRCSSSEQHPEGKRDRKLKCSDACALAKRNAQLAEALGVEKRETKQREVQYDPMLLQYYGTNKAWCDAMEAQITEFVKGDKAMLHLPVMKRPQRTFVHELTDYFDVRSESLDEEPRRSVAIHRQSNSGVPTPTLAEAWAATHRQSSTSLTFGSLRKAAQPERLPHNAVLLEGILGYEDAELREILAPHLRGVSQSYELQWLPTGEDVLLTFPSTSVAATIEAQATLTKRVDALASALQNAAFDSGFCTNAEAVHVAPSGNVTRGSWTPVRSTTPAPHHAHASTAGSTSATPATTTASTGNAWFGSSNVSSKNAFSALSASSTPFVPQTQNASGDSGAGLVGQGYHRPPRAVVGPSVVEERIQVEPRTDVPDNWDEEATE